MNEKARSKGRMAIYAMAGFYLVYQACQMFQSLNTSQGAEKVFMIIFMILFGIVGVAMMVMGITVGYKLAKDNGDHQKPEKDEAEEKKEQKEQTEELEIEKREKQAGSGS